jgi:hypothetical protein
MWRFVRVMKDEHDIWLKFFPLVQVWTALITCLGINSGGTSRTALKLSKSSILLRRPNPGIDETDICRGTLSRLKYSE